MTQVDWRTKFPKMTPGCKAPKLYLLNGCGVSMHGRREEDEETRTFVSTWCLCVLFIPIFCLRAYRVGRQGNRWYFLGREPMSTLAAGWNVLVIASVLATIAFFQINAYVSSPGYQAKRQMAQAAGMVNEGHLKDGAGIYQGLVLRGTPEADNAAAAVNALLPGACQKGAPEEIPGVFSAAVAIARRAGKIEPATITDAGMKLAAARGMENPKAFVGVLDAISPLMLDPRPLQEERLALLQKWAQAEPANLEVIVPLAGLLQENGKAAEAKKLLMPVRDKLGDGEGARALGIILGQEGDLDGSYALLWPYVQKRLAGLDQAGKGFERVSQQLWDAQISDLKEHKGPASFYSAYESAGEDDRKRLVREFVNGKMKGDAQYIGAEEALRDAARVVPVALDLGVVMLQRAQEMPEGAEKKAQLESTEKVFLAIGGIAGESDQYRLSLGEVDYWLGKQADGQALFDEYLKSKGRDFDSLMEVGGRLRTIGADKDARALVEEAYAHGKDANEQHSAAFFRSVMSLDSDDEILWMKRSDLSEPSQRASLAKAIGYKALAEGRREDAVKQFKEAIDGYLSVPRNEHTLNEIALAYTGIFMAKGDRGAFDRSIDYFEQAVELNPKDPIMLYNAGTTLMAGGIADVIGDQLDLKLLQETGYTRLLGYLYQDAAGWKEVAARVAAHPAIKRACGYLEKSIVLSPKTPRGYEALSDLYGFTRNEEGLRRLLQLAAVGEIDHSDQVQQQMKYLAGEKDEEVKKGIESALKRSEAIVAEGRKKGGATAAAALAGRVEMLMRADVFGHPADANEVVTLAEEADKIHSSSRTRSTLQAALLFRASKAIAANHEGYRTMTGKYDRVLGAFYSVAIAAGGTEGALRQAAVQNADVQRVGVLTEEDRQRFPETSSVYDWALLRSLDGREAARVAEGYRHSAVDQMRNQLSREIDSADVGEAVSEWWESQIIGKPEEGEAALSRLNKLGVVLPLGQ